MTKKETVKPTAEKLKCGLVMPISSIDGCSEQHWKEVRQILNDAIDKAGFEANLVSHADDVGIIHKRIIQNLYDNPIVVCDVSGKNPNVMFELGMRLAFDKPTIIIKDNKTSYSFDTSSIEHLEYPRDLRFNKILEFKKVLSEKVKATYERSKSDPEYTTFLKHFGTFKVAQLEEKEVNKEDYISEELRGIKKQMSQFENRGSFDDLKIRAQNLNSNPWATFTENANAKPISEEEMKHFEDFMKSSAQESEEAPWQFCISINSGQLESSYKVTSLRANLILFLFTVLTDCEEKEKHNVENAVVVL